MSEVIRENSKAIASPSDVIAMGIRRFASNRSRFGLAMGLGVGAASFLCLALAIVFLDWFDWLSDKARWGASLCAYMVALIMAWRWGLGSFASRCSPTELASDLETRHPEFRESLLSSVELRGPSGQSTNGSLAFLEAIEHNTARQLTRVELARLFPWNRVRNVQVGLIVCLTMILGLCFVPGLQFAQRLKRAILPFVEISAPSPWRIEIVSPSDQRIEVPAEQFISISIGLSAFPSQRPIPSNVELEWSEVSDDGSVEWMPAKRVTVPIDSSDPKGYAATYTTTMLVGRQKARFRAFVNDARTPFQFVEPLDRPKVNQFHWTITPPSYTKLPPETTISPNGSLSILRGSSLKLLIDVNQSLEVAEFVFEEETNGNTSLYSMAKADNSSRSTNHAEQRWQVALPSLANGRFQIRLTSSKTYQGEPIRNTFSPWFRLEWVDDLPPLVSWKVTTESLWQDMPQAKESWIVDEADRIAIPCTAKDNLPLQKIAWEVSINDGSWQPGRELPKSVWQTLVANQGDAHVVSVNDTWDVFGFGLESGDMASVRWVATDLAGQNGYSTPLRFSIAESEFGRDRHRDLVRKGELVAPLDSLASFLSEKKEEVLDLAKKLRHSELSSEEQELIAKRILDWTKDCEERIVDAHGVGKRILPQLPAYIDQLDIELIMRCLAKLQREQLAHIRFGLHPELLQAKQQTGESEKWLVNFANERLDRSMDAIHATHDLVQRVQNVYRSWMGLWLQTGLTKDSTYLWQFQKQQVQRANKDLDRLKRSQLVAGRYWESIQKVASDLAPLVNQGFANRIPEWTRWMDQSRLQIADLCDSENPNSKWDTLAERIERDANDLKGYRWVFSYDSGLLWNCDQNRRDLTYRQGGLGHLFDRFAQIHQRRIDQTKDKSLPSTELALRRKWLHGESLASVAEGLRQMSDRREIHQSRLKNDPLFVADMGLAWRAFEQVFDAWQESPSNGQQSFEDLQLIAQAYRVLESFHDMVEARLATESIAEDERFRFRSLAGQFDHFRHWTAIATHIDYAHNKMREAKYPDGLFDQYNAIRWQERFSQASSKINARIDANNSSLSTAASEIEAILVDWSMLDTKSQPTVEAARELLRRFSPSLVDMAKKAAEETRQLERLTQNYLEHQDEKLAHNQEQLRETVQAQHDIAQRQTEALQKALLEQASSQELLDSTSRQQAQDRDQALNILNRALPEMNQAIEQALKTAQPEQSDLDQAIQKEQKLAKALEAIANHFSQESSSSAKSPSEEESSRLLDELAKESQESSMESNASAPTETSDYEKAEELQKLSQSDSKELLEALEKELKQDITMQEELKTISEGNESSASAELKSLANQEQRLSQRLENEDASLMEAKKLQAMQARMIAEHADQLAKRLMDHAQQAAARASGQDQSRSIEQATKALTKAAKDVYETNEQTKADRLNQVAQQLEAALNEARTVIASTEESLKAAAQNEPKDSRKPKDRQNEAANQLKNHRKEFQQQSQNLSRRWTEEANRQKNRSQQLSKELEQLNKQRDQAAKEAQKRPDDAWAADHLRRATTAAEQKLRATQAAQRNQELLQQQTAKLSEQTKRISEQAGPNLESPNPQALLAADQLEQAKQLVAQLAEQAQSIAKDIGNDIQTPEPALREVASQQSAISKATKRVSQDLNRSARHEQRLGNQKASQSLGNQAKAIQSVAKDVLDETHSQLDQAAADTLNKEQQFSRDNQGKEIQEPLSRSSTNDDTNNLDQASERLRELSDTLKDATSNSSTNSQSPSNGQPQNQVPGSDTQTGQGSGKRMNQESIQKARLLDSLDRTLFDSKASGQEQSGKQGQKNDSDANQSQSSNDSSGKQSQSQSNAHQSSVRSAAQQLASKMNQQRLQSVQQSQQPADSQGNKAAAKTSSNDLPMDIESYFLPQAERTSMRDWGKLRTQAADQTMEGTRESFDPEFDQAIQAYFKSLQGSAKSNK